MLNQRKKTQVEIHFPHIYFLTQLHRDFLPQLEDILKQGLKLILSITQHHIFMAMILRRKKLALYLSSTKKTFLVLITLKSRFQDE